MTALRNIWPKGKHEKARIAKKPVMFAADKQEMLQTSEGCLRQQTQKTAAKIEVKLFM